MGVEGKDDGGKRRARRGLFMPPESVKEVDLTWLLRTSRLPYMDGPWRLPR